MQQAHHRRLAVVVGAQLGQVEIAFLQVAFQLAGNRGDLAGAPVHGVQGGQQLGLAHHRRVHAGLEQALHFIEGEQVQRVGHADQQPTGLAGQDDGAKTPGHGFWQALHENVVELEVAQFDKRNLHLLGQRREQPHLGDKAEIDHRATEFRAAAFLLLQGQLQLRVGQQTGLNQQVAEAQLALANVIAHEGSFNAPARSLANRRELSSRPWPCRARR